MHRVKGFSLVNETEVDVFLEFSCFFDDPTDVGNLILVPLPFLNPAWTSGSSWFMYCWNLALRISSLWDVCNCAVVWTFFGLAFLWDWNKNWLFQSCGHSWAFKSCWHIECSTLTSLSFRIWNSSTGIPSPSLALFVVMLPKAHLTSHSRMSGSKWAIIPSWLSGLWRSFL